MFITQYYVSKIRAYRKNPDSPSLKGSTVGRCEEKNHPNYHSIICTQRVWK